MENVSTNPHRSPFSQVPWTNRSGKNEPSQNADLLKLSALIELVDKVLEADSAKVAAHRVVNEIQRLVGCHQVGLAFVGKAKIVTELEAISGMTTFDKLSDLAKAYQAACDEASRKEGVFVWPPLNPQSNIGCLALRQLVERQNVDAAVAVSFRHRKQTTGVLILTGTNRLRDSQVLGLVHSASSILGAALQQSLRAEKNVLVRTWKSISANRWTTKVMVLALVLGVSLGFLVPWPYSMHVSCKAEPMTRRLVGAPHDGIIQSALIRAESFVEQSQLLATMDSREIRWEIATLTAEKSRFRKEYDKELAADNIAKAQVALLEVDRIQKKLQLLEHREQDHAILAPISGMVLTGDLEKLNGAPVRMGQALFEVAQLDPLRIELEVPADEYFYLKPGQSVSIQFEGFVAQRFQGTIKSVRPRSEIRDGRNVFVAETELPNHNMLLRPGVQGFATITGDRYPIAWNLFHKAWEAVCRTNPTDLVSVDDNMSMDRRIVRMADASQ
jgi:multidrug resistance efflux pump